jgi:pimeloyl-ACP methyl ester carboxylesterase
MSICTCTRLPQNLHSSSPTAEADSVVSVIVLQHVDAHVHAKEQHKQQ